MILKDSRYEAVTVYNDDTGAAWLGTRQPIKMAPAEDDKFLAWNAGDRWDKFAARAWAAEIGDDAALLYWVICDINEVVNPFVVKSGTLFRIPTIARVMLEVLQ